MMSSMHWMCLKGLGGKMNSRIIGKVARFTVNLCDFMNGYHGKMIEQGIKGILLITPITLFFMWFMIVMS